MNAGDPGDRMVIQARDGSCFSVPVEKLSEFVLPEDTVVIAWAPGRYLVAPLASLEEFRMSDGNLMRFMVGRRMSRAGEGPGVFGTGGVLRARRGGPGPRPGPGHGRGHGRPR
jgi:hypothetical protein